MSRTFLATLIGAAVAAVLVPLAVAGGYPGYGGGSAAAAPSRPAATTVKVAMRAPGRILTDGSGRTLYLFEKDRGPASMCYGACAGFWPPVLTKGMPQAGPGAKASLLGTIRRKDGTLQVTYGRHPLYRFALDRRAGDTNGEGLNKFGAEWYVVSTLGRKIGS
jgi:predicted lipoprotein with Yx(FWY)xxD motif